MKLEKGEWLRQMPFELTDLAIRPSAGPIVRLARLTHDEMQNVLNTGPDVVGMPTVFYSDGGFVNVYPRADRAYTLYVGWEDAPKSPPLPRQDEEDGA